MDARSVGKKKVVIAGAGFGGLWAARKLAGSGLDVLVVDKRNFHTFLPLLYQVAAAELEPGQVAYPLRGVFRGHKDVSFALAEVQGLDKDNRVLKTDGPDIPYDCLILALGSETNFFGVPGAKENCFQLKTLDNAIAIRNQIMSLFEEASLTPDQALRRQMLTFAVAGGGPTGVEFAGALSELIRGPLAKDFPRLDLGEVRVVLLEAMGTILAPFPARLQQYALKKLASMGVEVLLNAKVLEVTPGAVQLAYGAAIGNGVGGGGGAGANGDDGGGLPTRTVVWTAGVCGPDVAGWLGLQTAPGGRVPVKPTLQTDERPEIFVIGDMAAFVGPEGRPLPMVAPVAKQQGRLAADNARRLLSGEKLKTFRYRDLGIMATIGRSSAVTRTGPVSFTGFPAWAAWLFVHLMMLIGFRGRLEVFINWAWDYLFFERAVRLIIPKPKLRAARGCPTDGEEPGTPGQERDGGRGDENNRH
jgi:NADH dehydrogenase